MPIPEKVCCSISRKWFVDPNGNPADKGEPVWAWCEAHDKPVALMSLEHEKQHDQELHGA